MSLADYNTSYILTVLCMLVIDYLMIRRLSKGNYFGSRQKWVNIMLVVSGICAFSDIMCILIEGVKHKFPVFFFNALFNLVFALVAFFLFYYMEKEYKPELFKKKSFRIIISLPVMLTVVLLILSYPFGIIFAVDNLGNYTRGPLYSFFYFVLANGYTIFTFVSFPFRFFRTNDKKKKSVMYDTLIFYLPVVIGSIIQMHNYYFPGCNIGLTTSVLFILIRGLEEEVEVKTASLELKNNELKEALEKANDNRDVITAIGKMYIAIYDINLDEGTYTVVHGISNVYRDFGDVGKTLDAISVIMNSIVSDEYKGAMAKFFDLHTLKDRLKDTNTVHADYKASDGRWISARFVVKTRNGDGSAHEVLYIPRVITSEKIKELEYQEEIVRSNLEAKKANLVKTDFLRRMSHDIRTPINGIIGMTNIAEHYSDDLKKQEECRRKVKNASNFLLELVNNVLDMSKLESGAMELDEVTFDFVKLLREVENITKMNGDNKGVRVTSDYSNTRECMVIGSPLHVKQIILNIASNAVKYTNDGGSVNLSVEETFNDGETVTYKMECRDNGIGMSKEFLEHAFEPFSQEKYGARTNYTGTGLGLAITKQLVDLMGGSISVSSELGNGSTFTYIQSFKLVDEKTTDNDAVENVSLDGRNVLVVDDNLINQEIARFVFEEKGAVVTCADNGDDALNKFKNNKYDLIVMDIMMPIMGGYEATRRIRAIDKDVLIFAMSANAFSDDVKKSLAVGMNEHLSKPLVMDDLNRTLAKYFK
ncbi:MAG: ATP-binding protein [Solobacterium sp.]|nr:ATP-binding protein [Solobacterium sp.]